MNRRRRETRGDRQGPKTARQATLVRREDRGRGERQPPAVARWDVVYGVEKGVPLPQADLVVDYDLVRLASADARDRICAELENLDRRCDRILINALPFTPTAQLKRDFAAAARLLHPGGTLLVVVLFKKAARLVRRLLKEVFTVVEPQRGAQVSFLCREPRADQSPLREDGQEVVYQDPVSGRELRFATRSGLFSSQEVDPGTQLLLATAGDLAELRVLDVGCGYGIVGATAAARGAAAVTLVDVDARAVDLSRRNLASNGLTGDVLLRDGTEGFPAATFDRVVSNPPTHAGSATLLRIFAGALRVLVPGGRALFVVREHLNYEKWMREMGTLRMLETANGYKILELANE